MDYDKLARLYSVDAKNSEEYIQAVESGDAKKLFAYIAKNRKSLETEARKNYDDKNVTFSDINELISDENESRQERGEEDLLEPIHKITGLEASRRGSLSKKALNVAIKGASDYSSKSLAFDAAKVDLGRRDITACFIAMCKDEKEAYEIGKKITNINEGNNRAEIREFVINGINNAKKALDDLMNVKNDAELVDYFNKNFAPFQLLSELQGNNIDGFNAKLGIELPKDFTDDWKKNYSKIAVDSISMRSKLLAIANPLYKNMDVDDVALVQGYDYRYRDQFEYIGKKAQGNKIGNAYTNPIEDLSSHTLMVNSIKYNRNINNPNATERLVEVLDSSITYKLYKAGLDSNLDKYIFVNNEGNEVAKAEALKNIALGQTYYLKKENAEAKKENAENIKLGNNAPLKSEYDFVMKLEDKMDKSIGIIYPTNEVTKFNLKGALNKNNKKDQKLFDDLKAAKEALKNEKDQAKKEKLQNNVNKLEGKVKDAKNASLTNVNKSLNTSLKDLYKKVKSENPWYIRNKKKDSPVTKVQNNLDKLLNDKSLDFNSKKAVINEIKAEANKYLLERAQNPNRKMSKHALAREQAMLQVLDSLRPIDKQIDEVVKDSKVYDKALGIVEPKKEKEVEKEQSKEFIEQLSKDLSDDLIIDTSKKKESVSKTKEVEKDKDPIIEINNPDESIKEI